MAIKFLTNHTTAGIPPETFKQGQTVKDRSAESEMHFVRRGLAAFVDDKGGLSDHEGRAVDESATATLLDVSNNRDGGGRDGLLPDGTPQRASSGPAEVVTSAAAGSATKPGKTTKPAAKD